MAEKAAANGGVVKKGRPAKASEPEMVVVESDVVELEKGEVVVEVKKKSRRK
jgi:hypothetical protein